MIITDKIRYFEREMKFTHIKKVLIANRGEIACRLIKCCKANGLISVAVFSSEDTDSLHVELSDESILLPGIGSSAYMNVGEIIQVAENYNVDVVMPGYGFLSENSGFALALQERDIVFAGPSAESIEIFGLKHKARSLAQQSGMPTLPGSTLVSSTESALDAAHKIGFPVMIKSTAGGGGMGLKVCRSENELQDAYEEVMSRGSTLFKNSGIYLEKFIEAGRHIEVQVFGNGNGDVITFGERECSVQRRHQKVIEEAPSPFISEKRGTLSLRERLCRCAQKLASSSNYKSAGTVEFLVDDETASFYFLEMNTRLQVEHGVTELVYNVDLVELMILQADYEASGKAGIPKDILEGFEAKDGPRCHAVEARIYAENPAKNFQPSPGILHLVKFPQSDELDSGVKLRIDDWISTGTKISPYFDPLLAKVMTWGSTRQEAVRGLVKVLAETSICGPITNIDFVKCILQCHTFSSGNSLTSFLSSSFKYEPQLIEFLQSGTYTTIQDGHGRERFGGGVPHGGPADSLHFQLANIVVGNDRITEALEISAKGPKIKFHTAAVICLTGASFVFKVNKMNVPMFTELFIPGGSTVHVGGSQGNGARAYLAIKGGFPGVAKYLGSKSCTPTLGLGGHQGRIIMKGDFLAIDRQDNICEFSEGFQLPHMCRPLEGGNYDGKKWVIRVIGGPHNTPDICDAKKMENFYRMEYDVNLNSNRGCTMLDGPADVFSRTDGGDGGTHPSNILEYPYPTCGISVVGSKMAFFGVDGGTLSGFVCISVPAMSEWWKSGQANVGDKIRFQPISYHDSLALNKMREEFIDNLEIARKKHLPLPEYCDELPEVTHPSYGTILHRRDETELLPQLSIRQCGDRMLVIDFGIRDFTLIHSARQKILETSLIAVDKRTKFGESLIRVESTTGALGVLFDPFSINRKEVVSTIVSIESKIPPPLHLKIPSRLYKIPCCFDHSALNHCISRYVHSQRPFAPYLPSNTEYIMRANNLNSLGDFKSMIIGQRQIVTAVSFFCGNTLAVNLDPRTRFKTGKYNPARTFTPKGAIGSGSVGQSIYSIDSPGGYMIWGMTLPDLCWNTFSRLRGMKDNKPWFFDNFDQIEYYEVDETELNNLNTKLLSGKLSIGFDEVELDVGHYMKFLKDIESNTKALNRQKAICSNVLVKEEAQSMKAWAREQEMVAKKKEGSENIIDDPAILKISGGMSANIFKIKVKVNDVVSTDDTLVILEAMKMEIYVRISQPDDESDNDEDTSVYEETDKIAGSRKFVVQAIVVNEGDVVSPNDAIVLVKPILN